MQGPGDTPGDERREDTFLAQATAQLFERDRFATKRELEELKKLAADASALFPAEFRSAEPSAVRMLFKRREAEKAATLAAAS